MFTDARPALRRLLKRANVVALLATLAVVVPVVAAEKLAVAERQAIEQTIRQQLDAFGHEDAERAFRFASPDIQRMFGTSEQFMRMVREHYEPVYRSASVRFVRIDMIDGNWVQTVQITDAEGKVWRAFFTMRRQADKGWKIGGCQLRETSALET